MRGEIGQNLGEAVSSFRGDLSDLAQLGQDAFDRLATRTEARAALAHDEDNSPAAAATTDEANDPPTEGRIMSKGIPTLITRTPDVAGARAALDQIQAEVAELAERRRNLLRDQAARLRSQGFEAFAIYGPRSSSLNEGIEVSVLESYTRWNGGGVMRRFDAWSVRPAAEGRFAGEVSARVTKVSALGAYQSLYIEHGTFTVALVDGRDILVIRRPDADTETWHRRSVSRLRTLARHEALRVRTRDRDVSLVDPFGNIIHQGTVLTAFAWILNIDLNTEVSA